MARTRLFDLLRRSYRLERSASLRGKSRDHLERARGAGLAGLVCTHHLAQVVIAGVDGEMLVSAGLVSAEIVSPRRARA